ncbi:MAG: hypothetical protein QOI77_3750 [Blastocatellia bacterium]|nr:hypothetical protein [Blastocatellia bacterium]
MGRQNHEEFDWRPPRRALAASGLSFQPPSGALSWSEARVSARAPLASLGNRRPTAPNSSSRVLAGLALPDGRASDTGRGCFVVIDEISGNPPDFIQRRIRKNCKETNLAAGRQLTHHY